MHDGSVNEGHFANIQWGSLLQINNQKCARNVKRTIKTSDMALILVELVESFAICQSLMCLSTTTFRCLTALYLTLMPCASHSL